MARLTTRLAAATAVLGGLFFSQAATADHASASAAAQPRTTIVLGRVSDDPVKHLPRMQAMAEYLAARLAPYGITKGEAIVARDNEEMAGLLRSGRVDLFSETVMSALFLQERANSEILLREWKKGVASYRSVIFTRKDSDVRTLHDLGGRSIGFEDPGSTSGFLVPFAMLRDAGLAMQGLRSPRGVPGAGRVGYIFTGGEINIAAMVARGEIDAGAFSDADWDDLERTPAKIKDQLRIVTRSTPILRSTINVRGDLRPEIRDAVKTTLLGIADDPDAADVRKAYWKVSQFDEITG